MPGLNDRAFVQVSFNCRSLVVREPSVTMHLQTLLQQSLQFVFGTTFHEHVPVRACRLGDFISLVVIVSFTVRDGAAAALHSSGNSAPSANGRIVRWPFGHTYATSVRAAKSTLSSVQATSHRCSCLAGYVPPYCFCLLDYLLTLSYKTLRTCHLFPASAKTDLPIAHMLSRHLNRRRCHG